jgi:hypothetical protein
MNEEIKNNIIELAKQFNVTKLIQFGSSLDSFETCNDIDFACDGLYDKNFFTFGVKLEKLLNKQIDLIPLLPKTPFIEYIQKNGKILYESKAY